VQRSLEQIQCNRYKSQSKTLAWVVVDLVNPAFAHEQLYVALSHKRGRHSARILCSQGQVGCDAHGIEYVSTTDVVERTKLLKTVPPAQSHEIGCEIRPCTPHDPYIHPCATTLQSSGAATIVQVIVPPPLNHLPLPCLTSHLMWSLLL
jgi:hypothetical protein